MTRKLVMTAVALVLLLVGCSTGSGKPEKTSDKMYELGTAALETTDEYLSGYIDCGTAESRLENASMHAEFQIESDKEDLNSDTLFGTEYSNDYLIYNKILLLQIAISDKNRGTGSTSEITDKRNALAKHLGMSSK